MIKQCQQNPSNLMAKGLLVVILSSLVLLSACARTLERRLVFTGAYGRRTLSQTPADYGVSFETVWLEAEDSVRLHAWRLDSAASPYWLIYFHGQGETVARYLPLTTKLHGLGYNVLSPEYRGYGLSEGRPSEAGLYRDARAAYRYLLAEGVQPQRVILYGYSLGTGVAVDLASQVEVGALILEAPYTTLGAVANAVYRVPPTLLQNRFDSASKIARASAPTVFIHARDDKLIAPEQARVLHTLVRGPSLFLEIRGGHAGMLEHAQAETLARLKAFLDRVLSP